MRASKRRSKYDAILDVIFLQFLSPLGCVLGGQDASQIAQKSIKMEAQMPSHVDFVFFMNFKSNFDRFWDPQNHPVSCF
ncbi:MAG: hypothetical protein VX026_14370, partial [Myxococcota bacterium]|nr:hypothetical protein [Myxococcota bacterium]